MLTSRAYSDKAVGCGDLLFKEAMTHHDECINKL